MKKILLIPALNIDAKQISLYTPYGLLSLQAVASRYGGGVDIFSPSFEMLTAKYQSSEELCQDIVHSIILDQYDTIGISTLCNSFHHSIRIAKLIKNASKDIQIIMGGPHVSAVYESALNSFKEIDAVFVGEAENSFADLMRKRQEGQYGYEGIKGIVTRNISLIPVEPVTNLDELPFIDEAESYLEIVNQAKEYSKRFIFPIEASRGCPYKCKYCSTKPYWGGRVRRKSPERLLAEMDRMNELTGQKVFSFLGDNFGSPPSKFMDFCRFMKVNAPQYRWGCSLRMDQLDIDQLDEVWDGGCRALFAGIESASQETLDRVNKNVDLNKQLDVVKKSIEKGFEVITSFIIGFPWETKDDVMKTYELHCEMLSHGAVRSRLGLLCPLPGAEGFNGSEILYDKWTSSVALDDIPMDEDAWKMILSHPDMFLQMGHYKTKNIERVDIAGILDAAFRINYLHARSRGSEKMWVG